jgi:hypothetical protein
MWIGAPCGRIHARDAARCAHGNGGVVGGSVADGTFASRAAASARVVLVRDDLGHVVHESRLELARLLLADFDPDVVGIAAQPFLVREGDRREVPDFLLCRADGSVLIVNVKRADRLATAEVADALARAARVFADRGWEHEVWSGANPQLLANVPFLAGYRRAALIEPMTGVEAMLRMDAALTIAGAEAAMRDAGIVAARAVVLHLLWSGRVRADLERPLTGDTELEVLR